VERHRTPTGALSQLTSYEGEITGTPAAVTAATTYTVTITVVDSAGATATAPVQIVVNPAAGGVG
jgi:hypothetical protein